ncbi:Auxin-responsive protein SAUR64 [Sesamum angolense]|uniref:Auxin-responsive protein SAUR64 n=1 Tax=Sesamum angolense TaxID=2727404 RepID=A0AAE1X507_9LAMI|nr:Auxin-responsive protein SAUR64 [Sesamum angolense]
MMIISPRKLIKMARKWQRVAALGRKRISFPRKVEEVGISDQSDSLELAEKGHFVVYTTDKVRFAFPIAYLNSLIFRELFRFSEEEFGLPGNGPITLPCDSQFMVYVNSLMQKKAAKDVEKALILSIAASRCSSSHCLHQQQTIQHMPLCGC